GRRPRAPRRLRRRRPGARRPHRGSRLPPRARGGVAGARPRQQIRRRDRPVHARQGPRPAAARRRDPPRALRGAAHGGAAARPLPSRDRRATGRPALSSPHAPRGPRPALGPGVVGIGETGLDFHYDRWPRPAQCAAFARTVALARTTGRPLVVHVREAHIEAAAILQAEGAAAVGGVIHCFTGDRDDARRYLDLGFAISVAGIVTFKNADTLRDAVRTVPLDRLLVETDAPYLAPVPHRGRRNEPAHVRLVAEAVATVRGEPLATVAAATTANARRL